MQEISKNEMMLVLMILKHPELDFNANSISKKLGLSAMGALKIAKRLEKEGILLSKKFGKAVFYKLNFGSDYAIQYLKLVIKREAEQAHSYLKMWISEIRKIKSADAAILFGSVIKKHNEANDIDVLFVTSQKKFSSLKKEIEEINSINIKKIHPVYQTKEDFINNLKKQDSIVLNSIKGIIVFGEDVIIKTLTK